MAAPKALEGVGGQGPEDINQQVAAPEIDISDFIKYDEGAQPQAQAGMGGPAPEQQPAAPRGTIPSFWTGQPVPAPTIEESTNQLKGLGAEFAGSASAMTAGGAAGALLGGAIGGFLGGPAAPITAVGGAEVGGAIGAFLGGAIGTKPAVNMFRNILGLESEAERSQLLDAAFSIPGLAVAGPGARAVGKVLKTEAHIAGVIESSLSQEQKKVWGAMRTAIGEQASELAGEKFSRDVTKQVQMDLAEALNAGMNEKEALKFATDKAAATMDGVRKFDELTNMFGGPITQEEQLKLAKGQKTPRTSPGDVLKNLTSEYNANWNASVAALRENSAILDSIDLQPAIENLKALKENKAFGKQYARQIDEAISAVENSNAVGKSKVFSPAQDKMIILDASGKEVAVDGAAFAQKAREQKLIAIDRLINLRQTFDKSPLASGVRTPQKQATLDVVQGLRRIEDDALNAMASSEDEAISELGKNALISKGRVASHLSEMKKLGKIPKTDAISYANRILSDPTAESAGALRNTLDLYPESRGAVMSEMLNSKLASIEKPVLGKRVQDSASDALLALADDTDFLAKMEALGGDTMPTNQLKSKLKNLANIYSRAGQVANKSVQNNVKMQAATEFTQYLIGKGIKGWNPITWVNILSPGAPELAKRMTVQIFKNNPEAFIDGIVSTPGETIKSVRFLESMFGERAAPIVQAIKDRTAQSVGQAAVVAPLRAEESPQPMMAPQPEAVNQ